MIYDLKELKDRNLRATEYGSPTSDFAVIRSEILLAIAERLEALVEAQKPRLQGEPDRNENETPQPVATLCEAVEKLLAITDQQYCGAAIERALTDCRRALSAERKRAELVGELLEYLGFYINAEEGAVSERDYYELVRRYRALDAFDKGAEK